MRRHHRWDEEDDRPEPDLTDPATSAAWEQAVRDVRRVRIAHLALVLIGVAVLALAAIIRSS